MQQENGFERHKTMPQMDFVTSPDYREFEMPSIHRQNGFRFYFYSHEPNEPPHIHVDKGEATIKVWLDSLEVAKSRGFRAHEISGIIDMVSEHRAMFTEKWHEYFG